MQPRQNFPGLHLASKVVVFFISLVIGSASLSADPFQASAPQMNMDALGNAVSVWESFVDGVRVVQSATFSNDTQQWSAPITISAVEENASMPFLAVNEVGDAVAIWNTEDTNLGIIRICAAMLPFEGTWTTPEFISDTSESATTEYVVRLTNLGEIIATWSSYISFDQQVIRAASATFGGSWSAPVTISGS